ncbi:hypothetical protein CORT_0G02220 [Candida orthopsilosis Co 90-125]|uniref:RRM domain-containing protein n=1 Tax=Candida orthopsilosis (strain 90-125) TaxID=1136231 RepID=H8XAQ2_CANO9|nr:hypothetical protein CORT_0G02220 [Candida orthopsilosis Co 90-125]CCG24903.1 hypothetical protein CORT_0G02220 [Candida orthopsilosis Co 90-125]
MGMASTSYFKSSSFNGYTQPSNAMPKTPSQTFSINPNEERNGYFKRQSLLHKINNPSGNYKQEYLSEPSEDGNSSTSSQQQPQQDLINCINEHIFTDPESDNTGFCNFPVGLKIHVRNPRSKAEIERIISQLSKLSINEEEHEHEHEHQQPHPHKTLSIGFKSKSNLEDLIYRLYDRNIEFELDYSKFVSHPGMLFIKNLSSDLVFENNSLSGVSPDPTSNDRLKEYHKLYQFLNDNCYFKSLQDIRLFNNDSSTQSNNHSSNGSPNYSPSSTAFAIVKFANYLDVDILIEKLSKRTPNIFNDNPNIPLFLNRYINKRERLSFASATGLSHSFVPRRGSSASISANSMSTSSSTSSTSLSPRYHYPSANLSRNSNDNFCLIILENLINFLPSEFTKDKCEQFLNKIRMFGNQIESIYIPIIDKDETLSQLHPLDFGYIRFKSTGNFTENTFRVLYYLNDLSWDEVMALDMKNLPPLMEEDYDEGGFSLDGSSSSGDGSEDDDNNVEFTNDANGRDSTPVVMNRKLSVTIAQHKHNHYLFSQASQYYLSFNPSLLNTKQSPIGINYPSPIYTINSFIRNVNYQETNLYVNNFSVVFNNDDITWESFWKQFGLIKSAKIIKPHFYQDEDSIDGEEHKAGRIGFIFYETFKMAIRAILMTNNKLVHVDNFNPMIIQSSFAIQKSNASHKAFPLPPVPPMVIPNSSLPLDFPPPSNKILGSAAHANPGGGMQYYTYQPIVPYYYGYHPNPYLFGAQSMFNAGAKPNLEQATMSATSQMHVGNGQSNEHASSTRQKVSNQNCD